MTVGVSTSRDIHWDYAESRDLSVQRGGMMPPAGGLTRASGRPMPTRRLFTGLTVLTIIGAFAAVSPLGAQTVRGRVMIVDKLEPIPAAALVLTDTSGNLLMATRSDTAGYFAITAPAPGLYVLRGYAPGFKSTKSLPLILTAGRTIEVRVNLQPGVVLLSGVTVYGTSRYTAFRDRRELEKLYKPYRYRWFDQKEMARWHATDGGVGGVLRAVPLAQYRCHALWLDGEYINPRTDWRYGWVMGEYPFDWLYGVEVFYNKGDAPREFQRWGDANCGVILAWTRPVNAPQTPEEPKD